MPRELVKYIVKPGGFSKFKSASMFSFFFLFLQVPKASLPSPALPFPCFPMLSYIEMHSFIGKNIYFKKSEKMNQDLEKISGIAS